MTYKPELIGLIISVTKNHTFMHQNRYDAWSPLAMLGVYVFQHILYRPIHVRRLDFMRRTCFNLCKNAIHVCTHVKTDDKLLQLAKVSSDVSMQQDVYG